MYSETADMIEELLIGKFASVFFEQGSSQLTSESEITLDKIVNIMGRRRLLHFNIYGYASQEGNASYNQRLSNQRANAMRDYLVQKLIVRYKLTTVEANARFRKVKGKGGVHERIDDDETRKRNRRATFCRR